MKSSAHTSQQSSPNKKFKKNRGKQNSKENEKTRAKKTKRRKQRGTRKAPGGALYNVTSISVIVRGGKMHAKDNTYEGYL